MKIWVLNHNRRGYGTWHRAWNFARQLQRHGHAITFFTVNPQRRIMPERYREEDIDVWLTPYLTTARLAASGLDAWDVAWRTGKVLAGDWDALYIFSSLPNVGIPLFYAAKRYALSRACFSDWDDLFCDGGGYEYLNGGWTRPIYKFERWLEIMTKRKPDGVTVTSHYLLDRARELRVDDHVAYIPTGANIQQIPPIDKAVARSRISVPSGSVILTYLGAGYHPDGMLLLEALALARQRCPKLFLLFVGGPDPRYDNQISTTGLSDAVRIMGWIPFAEVPYYLAAADILVMPMHDSLNSRARGPIKLRDYLCAGRPIVGTALGETGYVLGRYQVGQLADLPATALADALVRMAGAPETWDTLGREARRVAEQELAWDILGTTLNDVLMMWWAAKGKARS